MSPLDSMLTSLAAMIDVANIRSRQQEGAGDAWKVLEHHDDGYTLMDKDSGDKFRITVEVLP